MATILKESVYTALEKKVSEESDVEQALRMINRDARLQTIFREYAQKYDISIGRDSCDNSTNVDFWELWSNHYYDAPKKNYRNVLYINPIIGKKVAPIYVRSWHYENDDDFGDGWFSCDMPLTERNEGFYISGRCSGDPCNYRSKRLIHADFAEKLTGKTITKGLERLVERISKCKQK